MNRRGCSSSSVNHISATSQLREKGIQVQSESLASPYEMRRRTLKECRRWQKVSMDRSKKKKEKKKRATEIHASKVIWRQLQARVDTV